MSEAVRKVIIKKVKKNHGGGHHGGSWKVAYADFVTAMMAFFLLLWLLSMVSEDKRIAMAEYFKSFSIFKESGKTFQPGSAFVITDHIKKAELRPENITAALKKAMKNKGGSGKGPDGQGAQGADSQGLSDQIIVDAVEGGVRIQIVDKEGSPMFKLGSAEPTDKAREILASVAEVIRDQDAKIAIEGHTDAAPFRGDQITNWELSTNRASAARRMLETNGFDPSRVARVVGYADTDLFIKENPKDPQNRRISIIILQPREGSPVAGSLRKEAQASTQGKAPAPQAQQAQTEASDPAVESSASKENAARQSFQQKKAEMKKKRRDVMGLWD
jgi:chemotaxis protein MotB